VVVVVTCSHREERSFNQLLRQEQDEAYQQSLIADQEKVVQFSLSLSYLFTVSQGNFKTMIDVYIHEK